MYVEDAQVMSCKVCCTWFLHWDTRDSDLRTRGPSEHLPSPLPNPRALGSAWSSLSTRLAIRGCAHFPISRFSVPLWKAMRPWMQCLGRAQTVVRGKNSHLGEKHTPGSFWNQGWRMTAEERLWRDSKTKQSALTINPVSLLDLDCSMFQIMRKIFKETESNKKMKLQSSACNWHVLSYSLGSACLLVTLKQQLQQQETGK